MNIMSYIYIYIYMEECILDVVQTSTLPLNEGDILNQGCSP